MKSTVGDVFGPLSVHTVGRTAVTVTSDGKNFVSVSEDTFVKVYSIETNLTSSKCIMEFEHENALNSVETFNNLIICGAEEEVVVFDMKTKQVAQILVRTSLPVRNVCISVTGKYLSVASDDMKLKLFNIEELYKNSRSSLECRNLTGIKHSGCFARFTNDEQSLAVLTTDGSVYIYSIDSEKDSSYSHCISNVFQVKIAPEYDSYGFCFSTGGHHLIIPVLKELHFISTSSYEFDFKLSPNFGTNIQFCFTSMDKNFVLIGSKEAMAVVDLRKQSIISQLEFEQELSTSVKFHLKDKFLIFSDQKGRIWQWNNFVDLEYSFSDSTDRKATSEPTNLSEKDKNNIIDDEAGEDSDSLDDLEDEDQEDDFGEDLEDFIEYEDGEEGSFSKDSRMKSGRSRHDTPETRFTFKKMEPFQPNSTKFIHDQTKRYLVYNLVGIVTTMVSSSFENVINIEFHDLNNGRPINIKDTVGFHVASLTLTGCAFASSYDDTKKIPSMIYYRMFESWSHSNDSKITLDAPESVEAIALSSRSWIAVTTNFGYLKVFSCTGLLILLWKLPLPVVSLSSKDDFLFILYQDYNIFQRYKFQIVDISAKKPLSSPLELCTTKKEAESVPSEDYSKLIWIGFCDHSEIGLIPAAYDEEGVLFMSFPHHRYNWTPVLDTRIARQGKQDYYWPVAVTEDQLLMIMCKAGDKSPTLTPKPIVSEIYLNIPIGDADSMKEQLFRQNLFLDHFSYSQKAGYMDEDITAYTSRKVSIDKSLLILINKSVKSGNTMLALDLCSLLQLEKSYGMAYNIANKAHEKILAGRIEMLKKVKFEEKEVAEEIENFEGGFNEGKKFCSTPAPSKGNNLNELNFSTAKKTPVPLPPIESFKENSENLAHESSDTPAKPPQTINPFKKRMLSSSEDQDTKKLHVTKKELAFEPMKKIQKQMSFLKK